MTKCSCLCLQQALWECWKNPFSLCFGKITKPAMGAWCPGETVHSKGCSVLPLSAQIVCWSIFCWGVVPVRRERSLQAPASGKCRTGVFSLPWQLCFQMQTTCPVHAWAASRCPELHVCSRLVLELLIMVKIKGGSVCIVCSRKEQCKISSTAVQIPCYFWYLTSAKKIARTTGHFHFYYVFLPSYS